jgi:hypothetical protein
LVWFGDPHTLRPNQSTRPDRRPIVFRYTTARTPPYALDPGSARTVIAWESDGHNGGADGFRYVTSGDGTSDSDTDLTGQRTDLLLAKVLRIDVDRPAGGKAYSVPEDNPFVGDGRFAPETWACGLRNPWRIACDPQTGHVRVGNNGQDLWEQAYLIRKGENYGWSVREGGHPFYPNRAAGPTPFTGPTVEHPHPEARSPTGGVVYRGSERPELKGAYLYGDHSTGRIWAVKHDGDRPDRPAQGTRRHPAADHGVRPRPGRRAADLRPRTGRGRRVLHPGAEPEDDRRPVPPHPLGQRAVRVGQGPPAQARGDPLLGGN